nr:IS30 family transposase [Streptosporangium sp. 'caverna']
MTPCGSRTRRSTRPCSSRGEERSSGSWSPSAHRACTAGAARTRTAEGRRARDPRGADQRPPAEAEDRAVPGHWEGDLIIGTGRSAIGTLVESTTRFTLLLHLPRMDGYGTLERVKNGPALAGRGAQAVRDAITKEITGLPEQLRRSLTWDRGTELAQHTQLRIDTGLPVYFADPHNLWQRGTNENTNGLLRQYFPKGTDLSRWGADELAAAAFAIPGPERPSNGRRWQKPSAII